MLQTGYWPAERDVDAFEERAARYEQGRLGQLHREIVGRVTALALAFRPSPSRILDVGCGTGYQLRLMASRCPDAAELAGVDAAPAMVKVAEASSADQRIAVRAGFAEQLPYEDGAFDLVLSTTSFDHWADQKAGLRECARVLAADGHLVLADLFSLWLVPTLVGTRGARARTKNRANRLFAGAGLRVVEWRDIYPLIKAVVAVRLPPDQYPSDLLFELERFFRTLPMNPEMRGLRVLGPLRRGEAHWTLCMAGAPPRTRPARRSERVSRWRLVIDALLARRRALSGSPRWPRYRWSGWLPAQPH